MGFSQKKYKLLTGTCKYLQRRSVIDHRGWNASWSRGWLYFHPTPGCTVYLAVGTPLLFTKVLVMYSGIHSLSA